MPRALDRLARRLVLGNLAHIQGGCLEIICPHETLSFGRHSDGLRATVAVADGRFYRRLLSGGDIGFGESFMDGDWSSPDLVSLFRLAIRNLARLEQDNAFLSAASRAVERLRHKLRANTISGSRRNIHAHYDRSNDFFRLFLDTNMVYSCGWYKTPHDSLEEAQVQKLDRVCRKLMLDPGDHVLEIGTGWGAFALHAARHYGCRVTTTTISEEQHAYARELFARAGESGRRIQLLKEDYRNLSGTYDKIASIEMFEAVGLEHYSAFFGACDRLLDGNGLMLLQTITMNEQKFPQYRRTSDWIKKYIFPGSELASVAEIARTLGRDTRLSLFNLEDMGTHYARTLAEWRSRFNAALPTVRALGFDDRFIRMWEFYLAYCEAAFLERHISDVQLLLTKLYNRNVLPGEPWEVERGVHGTCEGLEREPVR